ncbi:ubiquitin carboxyl-terminal hydrolase 7-like [Drosophila innubila]|uniref:ubiquitin carboxyl-terminal hydrolase 7-like n=1 Tax=Drosophila innubila TaxID=198719 RepID=UPI00148B4F75|nr:ubiquitin carboxyl-terminal hydrolase 7-like [Drosophila innubila]
MATKDEIEVDKFRSQAIFSYTFDNVGPNNKAQTSEPFYVRMLPWSILIVPHNRALGVFLQCNADSRDTSWSCHAIAKLNLVCYKPNAKPYTCNKIDRLFNLKGTGWGLPDFITWEELNNPDNCYVHNDSITIEVHVIADAPHGIKWDSKKHTGYIGLRKRECTRDINSVLQMLYFTNALRSAVYQMQTNVDIGDESKFVVFHLQRIFHELQFGDCPVDAKKPILSILFEDLKSFMPCNAQDFLCKTIHNLETAMKDTSLEDTIPGLFKGKMTSFFKSTQYFNSTKTFDETFYDIKLNIEGKKNIYDSLKDYIATKKVDHGNSKCPEMHCHQASKRVIFTSFPPVLHIYLNRFQFNPVTNELIKDNNRFKFYDEIHLDGFLAEREKTPADYVLHSVLVHSGDKYCGHYVVFINPKADGRWFKFDNELVSRCQKEEAIEQNYGGKDDEILLRDKDSSVYMLVYVRKSEIDRVLCDIPEKEIFNDLIERLDLKHRMEPNLDIPIPVMLKDYFESQEERRLIELEQIFKRPLKVRPIQTVKDMVEMLVTAFNLPRDRMRMWDMWDRSIKEIPKSQRIPNTNKPIKKESHPEDNKFITSNVSQLNSVAALDGTSVAAPTVATFNATSSGSSTKATIAIPNPDDAFFLQYLGNKLGEYSANTKNIIQFHFYQILFKADMGCYDNADASKESDTN